MTLKRWVIVYLIALHLILAASFMVILWENRLWLFAVEAVFLVSFSSAIILFNRIFNPPQVSVLGSEFLKEQDFQSKFRTVGHPEVDRLVQLYNAIAQNLQNERVRLEEQEYFLGKLLDASPSGVVTCDFDRQITFVNPAAERILNIKYDELIGRLIVDIGSHLTSELSALAVGESVVITLPGRRQIKGWKLQLMDRGFPREFVMFEELTDEIRRFEKDSYEKLVRLMAHEVNNTIGAANSLLHSCLNYANQIRSEDRADFEGALNTTISRTEHLNTFMRAFSELVRLPRPQLREYDLLILVRNSVTLHRPELEKRRIKVTWRTEPATLVAKVDIGQIEQVLVNLVKNAVEAIGNDGTITIVTGTSGSSRFLGIENTGAGIPPEVTDKLFTPFFTTKAGGQGIGLTFAAEVLTQHGFRFSLMSESGFTRFCIYI
jgi:nitrogen fixation/metabolism regulation signal transduction histidine kinase